MSGRGADEKPVLTDAVFLVHVTQVPGRTQLLWKLEDAMETAQLRFGPGTYEIRITRTDPVSKPAP